MPFRLNQGAARSMALAREVVQEVPKQVCGFMSKYGIKPRPRLEQGADGAAAQRANSVHEAQAAMVQIGAAAAAAVSVESRAEKERGRSGSSVSVPPRSASISGTAFSRGASVSAVAAVKEAVEPAAAELAATPATGESVV